MFNSQKQPLLQKRRSEFSFRHLILILLFGFVFTCALVRGDFQEMKEAAVGGNELGNKELGLPDSRSGSRPSTPDLEAGPASAPGLTAPNVGAGAIPGGTPASTSSRSSSPVPHEAHPYPPLQAPGRSQSPLPSTKTGKEPVHEASETFGPSGVAGLGLTDIGPLSTAGSPAAAGPSGVVPPEMGGDEYPTPGTGLPPIPPPPPAAAPEAVPEGVPARCDDPENGFTRRVGRCSKFYYNHKIEPNFLNIRLTYSTYQIVYLVDNKDGVCAGSHCIEKDVDACCSLRPKCHPHFTQDVQGGCPATMIVNTYQGAYCESAPCTIADAGICCIDRTQALWERTDRMRSKYARTMPNLKSPVTKPEISFAHNDVAWFDMSKKRAEGTDEWAPLVNFMMAVGEGTAWKTEAWMRVSANGKMLYRPLPIEKMFKQGQVPPVAADTSTRELPDL